MKFSYLDWDCGSGKTTELLRYIAANPDLYILALNKIDLFEEHQTTLNSMMGSTPITTIAIHSKDGVKGMSVGARIVEQVQSINATDTKHCVIFITHEALLLIDWKSKDRKANRWRLFIDEAPKPWQFVEKEFEVSQDSVLQYIAIKPENEGGNTDGKYIAVKLTDKGEELRRSTNDGLKIALNSFLNAASGCRDAFADKSFFGIGNNSTILSMFSIIDPEAFTEFKEATILAANFEHTFVHQMWSLMGVEFTKHNAFNLTNTRTMPLKDRIRIHYFSKKGASQKWLKDKCKPLKVVSDWIDQNITVPFYYTFNDAKDLAHIRNPLGEKIKPIALGSNELKGKTVAIWLAALLGKPNEYRITKELFGIDRKKFDRAREHENLYQFAMRSNLREFNSTEMVDVYVLSEHQAKVLQEITGAEQITWVGTTLPEPVDDDPSGGKKQRGAKKRFTDDEARERNKERDREYRLTCP